jgi:cyclic beta-1,2-glucan synthetase
MTLLTQDSTPSPEEAITETPLEHSKTLENLAAELAAVTSSVHKGGAQPLPILEHPDRLRERLNQAYVYFTQASQESHVTSYAAEWFLDNHYIVQQAVEQIEEDMPARYYKRLPRLVSGPLADYPRAYVLAHALGQFLQGRITAHDQQQFIEAYQEHALLTSGELWAWPAMLRVTEIENLITALDELVEVSVVTMRDLVPVPVHEHYSLSAEQDVVVANCVLTLRGINTENWLDFFEKVSRVEAILRRDPLDIYRRMDFETRNRYRRCIEKLADYCDKSEEQIAAAILQLTQRAAGQETGVEQRSLTNRMAHVGYYLIDEGLAETRRAIAYRQPFTEMVGDAFKKHALFIYLGSTGLITAFIVLAAVRYAMLTDGTWLQVLVVVLLALIPASTTATHLVNWVVTKLVAPRTLPKMDFSMGIPEAYRTMIAIPAMLTDAGEIDSLAEQLEQHYLRNTDPNLSFAILADYPDAEQEHMPQDDALREHAAELIAALNARYSDHEPFYFFLRERRWNPSEQKWMGYERKRGKLAEFNRLILEPDAETSYFVKQGDLSSLQHIRYVITLDADTILPRDSASRLIGTFAHPLNQAHFNEAGQINAGYTVLQPRVEILPTVANKTEFTRIFAGESGVDLYTLAVSDVYQDLFGEGIFVGKGAYDIAAFERSLHGRVPENALLSHDLFEGLHGRAALVTDVVLFEDYPTHYLPHVSRIHRWVRGDWQLLPWLLPRVPAAGGGSLPNIFSALDMWKIVDNLRRSLLQSCLLWMILLGWLWLPGSAFVWVVFALLVLLVPFLIGAINSLDALALNSTLNSPQQHNLLLPLARWGLSIAFLPYEAQVRLDAIIVTLRRLAQRKRLLEWTASASVNQMFLRASSNVIWQRMFSSLILVGVVAVIALLVHPSSLLVSLPLVVGWFGGPAVAERISRPIEPETETLTQTQERRLRTLARRTWLFFEEFVGPNDHWLPPDHYQRGPIERVGHYTSPTNIGLLLLSTLAAYDQGYIGLLEFLTRMQVAFESIAQLERYRGHLLNWYSTQTLQPLLPRYVSTVDNGNFAGCLLILRRACHELLQVPVVRPQCWQGVIDTLDVLSEILDSIEISEQKSETRAQLDAMREAVLSGHDQPEKWIALLEYLAGQRWQKLSDAIVQLVAHVKNESDAAQFRDLRVYLSRLQYHLNSIRRDVDMLLPWLAAIRQAPSDLAEASGTVRQMWQALRESVSVLPRFGEVQQAYTQVKKHLSQLRAASGDNPAARQWCDDLAQALEAARNTAADLLLNLQHAQQDIDTEFASMDFSFLYDPERHLFHLGYNVDSEHLDISYYDLLASEARLASFLAIARRDVPQKHWLHLSRPVTQINHKQTLFSWGGTSFEYFMPLLFMRNYPNTLLHQSYEAVVEHQREYGRKHGVPWGISESGYYAFDGNQNYQYRAFGLPTVALKRGQDRDIVVAPYASLIVLPVAPARVADNIEALVKQGALTTYGFVEAIDYTEARLPLGVERAFVAEYMAHHQGMIFLSLANHLHSNIMVERFHADPRVQSIELLLMEKIPQETTFEQPVIADTETRVLPPAVANTPWEVPVEPTFPQAHLVSNGRYSVMMTSGGGGYSQWKSRAITRWRADATLDDWGQWIYIRDGQSGGLWSPTYQPVGGAVDWARAMFHLNHVEFQARAYDISSRLDVLVPPDDDLEIRRLALTNHDEKTRRVTISSYAEMVLAPQSSDQRHQAFNKMFIESEYLPDLRVLLFRRRLRSAHDDPMFVLHLLVTPDEGAVHYETDRARFIGRNRTYRSPAAFGAHGLHLSGTTGATLDPIMALACDVSIPAHSTVEVAYITIAGDSQENVIALAQRYRQWGQIDQAFSQSRYRGERELRSLGLDSNDIARFQRMLSALLYPQPTFRAQPEILALNSRPQPSLWAYGISGDYPIVLVQINDEEQLELVYELVQAHRYWRNRGFTCTLVILNQRDTGYMQELYNQIHRLIVRSGSEIWINRHDGIFILRAEQLGEADRNLLRTAARVLLDGEQGTLQQQLDALASDQVLLPPLIPTLTPQEIEDAAPVLERPGDLMFDNLIGGFTPDGREYVMYIDRAETTPAPWINVIANANGGFILSEAGGGYSWAQNSGENRLTVWRNDPVSDVPGEAIYLRDEETVEVWSPTLMPAGTNTPYLVRHGAGYSVIEHQSHGLRQTVHYCMAPDDPVKFARVHLKNTASRPRRVTITYYAEWVLGPLRDVTQQYLIPEFDPEAQALMVRNPYSIEFGAHHAFVTADRPFHGMTADRTEFLGRMGSYAYPAALWRVGLNSNVRAGIDSCAAIQLHIDLPVDGEGEVCFMIGSGDTRANALELIERYRQNEAIEAACRATVEQWRKTLDSIVVRTPDPAMNLLLPWLLYQALSCRIWGRSALYQSSGAYGFRDQLQDVMSLVHVRPDLARKHILRAARHQFDAGDVLHWWHPPSGRGVRTRFSDDLVWLPYVVSFYVKATGDEALLDVEEPFLKGEPLRSDEEERYGFYEWTADKHTIYEHCRRALERAYDLGRHKLPLMKAGDWNDGMNRVGIEGRGESVWMGWFLYTAMRDFGELCQKRGDDPLVETYQQQMDELKQALEEHAWDGEWYLRAFYDDGTPLGSHTNLECQIDSLAQSWGMLSGAANPQRAQQAMDSVRVRLVDVDNRLIRLFTPAFDQTDRDPGYIKGYPPGIRENGGQYTHAALWYVWALAEMGKSDLAYELFSLLNPINHSDTPSKARHYGVEPYVIAADIYGEAPHTGQGGWTWYTGSSGWMYRLGVEAILGLHREGNHLRIEPRASSKWAQYEVDYRFGETIYHITVENPARVEQGVREVWLDDTKLESNRVPLTDDGRPHQVRVIRG